MKKDTLERFLLKARTQTYAGATRKSKPLLPESVQYDYAEEEFSYRDIYYLGNGIFSGLETVFHKDKPVWSMSYFGDFSQMTEQQADTMLRKALTEHWQTTRLYTHVEKDYGDFTYECDGSGSIDHAEGSEEICAEGESVYRFYYAGGFIG